MTRATELHIRVPLVMLAVCGITFFLIPRQHTLGVVYSLEST